MYSAVQGSSEAMPAAQPPSTVPQLSEVGPDGIRYQADHGEHGDGNGAGHSRVGNGARPITPPANSSSPMQEARAPNRQGGKPPGFGIADRMQAGRGGGGNIPEPPDTGALAAWRGGDIDSGKVFADRYAGKLVYVSRAKIWRTWDGARWAEMTDEDVHRCAKETAEIIMSSAFAAYMADPDANKKPLQEAIKVHKSMHAIDGMIKAAHSETSLNISDPGIFDADPWLLGVANGVLDLRTGRLLKAEPNQYITNQAGFPYDPAAQCPLWLKTLDEIFEGNAELVDLLQRLVGYSLTGDVDAEIFVYLDGPGGNGKSVVAKVISSVLGSYSCEVQTAAMTERDVNGTLFQRQLVKVIGKRAAWANETSKDDVFDDSAIKIMSSKDKDSGPLPLQRGVRLSADA